MCCCYSRVDRIDMLSQVYVYQRHVGRGRVSELLFAEDLVGMSDNPEGFHK